MAMQTKTIKQKMKSVANIGKITKAMEMISVAKMKRAVEERNSSLVFAKESYALLENLYKSKNLPHPYMEQGEGEKILLVIIASNKGLCGGYNVNVSKKVSAFIEKHKGREIEVISVGKQAQKIATRNKLNVISSFNHFSDFFKAGEVRSLLYAILDYYDSGEYAGVWVAYTDFINSLSFEPKLASFIPFSLEDAERITHEKSVHTEELDREIQIEKQDYTLYAFEPNEQEILDTVVPAVLLTTLFQYLLESLASEHSSRVSAMKNASENAQEMVEGLRINFNRARQAAITQEIAEIVGGSSAVS